MAARSGCASHLPAAVVAACRSLLMRLTARTWPWPFANAELSLLGALGCGRWLTQLIIDGLESRESPYRWLVLMATHNAIPFYQRMGFVRVGAVVERSRLADEDDHSDGVSSLSPAICCIHD